MRLVPRTSLVLTVVAALVAVAAASASAADVKLSYVTTKPTVLVGSDDPARQYDNDTTVWAECSGGATPLMIGWSGALAPIAIVYTNQLGGDTIGIAVRKPMRSASIRAHALCAKGPVGAKAKDGASGATSVSCPSGKLAIGAPISFGPYWDHAIASKPDGTRGWTNDEGGYGTAKVVCVSARAFGDVKAVRRAARFKLGSQTATVSATCAGGRRPISWGFEAGLIDQNTWRSSEGSGVMAVPFVATSKPKGGAGWTLTFATPDGAGARTAASVALDLTCATPR